MTELEKVIANLGYPVGMGMAPSPADLARMKSAIVNEWIEQLQREIAGHLKAWDIEHAEVERLRLKLEQAEKIAKLLPESAAEIERLRANVEREHQLNRPLVSEIERLKEEIEGHRKAWYIEHAEAVRLRAQLWTDDEVEHEMALARTAIIEECARMVEDCFDIEIARAIRALKGGP